VLAILLITNVLVVLAVTEYDTPSCRWARQPDGTLSVSWNYGTYIQSYPAWKTAFQQSAADWDNALTKLRLYYTSDAFITCNAYYEQSSAAGRGWVSCCSGSACAGYAEANVYSTGSYTTNMRRSLSGHELGHALALGHIYEGPSLMGSNPDPETYYTPQSLDVQFFNQVYP